MGNTPSSTKPTQKRRILTLQQRDLDSEGILHATIGDIWGWKLESYAGAYDDALKLRRYDKPQIYERLEDFCQQKKSAAEAGKELEEWLTRTTVVTRESGKEEIEVEHKQKKHTKNFIEPYTPAEQEVYKSLISIMAGTNRGRAHFLPADMDCNVFWGKYIELVCGADTGKYDEGTRQTMVDIVKDFRVNLLGLDGNHDEIFDKLKTGILLAIPLLENPAGWKQQEPYEILIVCDRPAAYKFFSRHTEEKHVYWATVPDLVLATNVITETAKAMADSLDKHWDEYYSQRSNNGTRYQLLSRLKDYLRNDGGEKGVRVPDMKKDISSSMLQFGKDHIDLSRIINNQEVKLIKIDLRMLYRDEFAKYIPDPWLMALKAATNWSAFAYPRHQGKYLKLASACDDDDSTNSKSLPVVSFLSGEVINQRFREDMLRRREAEVEGMSLSIVSDDDHSVSTLGDEDVAAGS